MPTLKTFGKGLQTLPSEKKMKKKSFFHTKSIADSKKLLTFAPVIEKQTIYEG